jgi:diacylglycerol kinase (ATP)
LQLDVHSLALAHASDPETPSTSSTTTTTTTTALASIATVTASSSPKLVHASSVDSVASIPSSPSPFDPSASISLSNKLNIVPLPETTPLVVFINPKSGGNQGAKLMRQLQFLLNPRQLFDLNDGGPARGLEMFQKVPGYQVLCCGGDGTVGWVLSVLDKLNPSSWPPIGIVPLGTGNDLARALNWGGGYTGEPMKRLLELYDTEIKYLDRWRLDITESVSSEDSEGDDAPLDIVNNYFSIGVDAHIARKFHLMREKHPQKFSSRARNKLWYAQFGTQDALQHKFKNVHQSVSLECDGVKLDLGEGHKLEGIAVVNITSMYGGADLWGTPSKNDTKFGQQDMGDGRLEVVGLYSSVHVGRLTTGISSGAHRICQGSVIRITTVDTLPMQVDGEPWMQRPGVIELTHKNKAPMLRKLAKKERESNRIPSKSGY